MARLREAQGDVAAALGLLEEAERVYVGDFSPNVRPIAAIRARVARALASDRRPQLGSAEAWRRPMSCHVPARVRARHPGPRSVGRACGPEDDTLAEALACSTGSCQQPRQVAAGAYRDVRAAGARAGRGGGARNPL